MIHILMLILIVCTTSDTAFAEEAQDKLVLTVEQVSSGNFQSYVSTRVAKSVEASAVLLAIGDAIVKASPVVSDDDNEDEDAVVAANRSRAMLQWRAAALGDLLTFVRDNRDTESSLTAQLLAAQLCQGEQKDAHRTACKMLDNLIERHPTTWQAQAAGLVKSILLYDDDRSIPEAERLRAAEAAVAGLIDANSEFDFGDPEVQLFLRFYQLDLENPVRLNAMLVRANCEYNLARTETRPSFDRAERLYQAIVSEFPSSRAAKTAAVILQAIDVLKRDSNGK